MPSSELLQRNVLLLDGGLGTTLEDLYNIRFSTGTPLWSSHLLISDPDTLQDVQNKFSASGADIILTPTYQASHAGFRKSVPGLTDEAIEDYFSTAVRISRNATGPHGLVALSLGAYGAVLQPSQEYSGDYGEVSEPQLIAFHRERLTAFDLTKVDIVAFETLPRLDEIRAVKAVVDGSTPYWISCVFPNDDCLPDGSTIDEALTAMMAEPRPWAIGLNCTKVHKVAGLINEFESSAKKAGVRLPRLVLYPDGTNGQVYDTTRQIWVGEEDEGATWHEKVYSIVTAVLERNMWQGVVVGGCCKTAPKHIQALSQLLHKSLGSDGAKEGL